MHSPIVFKYKAEMQNILDISQLSRKNKEQRCKILRNKQHKISHTHNVKCNNMLRNICKHETGYDLQCSVEFKVAM
jgi:hypothetical protein